MRPRTYPRHHVQDNKKVSASPSPSTASHPQRRQHTDQHSAYNSYVAAIVIVIVFLCTVQLFRSPQASETAEAAGHTISHHISEKTDRIQQGWRDWWKSNNAEDSKTEAQESKDQSSFGDKEDEPAKLGNEGTWFTPTAPGATPSPSSDEDAEDGEETLYTPALPTSTAELPEGFNPMKDTFDVPEDIYYDPAGPRPDQVILLTASDGKGHNGGIADILGSTARNRAAYCEKQGYINQFINISKYDLEGAHPVRYTSLALGQPTLDKPPQQSPRIVADM